MIQQRSFAMPSSLAADCQCEDESALAVLRLVLSRERAKTPGFRAQEAQKVKWEYAGSGSEEMSSARCTHARGHRTHTLACTAADNAVRTAAPLEERRNRHLPPQRQPPAQ